MNNFEILFKVEQMSYQNWLLMVKAISIDLLIMIFNKNLFISNLIDLALINIFKTFKTKEY